MSEPKSSPFSFITQAWLVILLALIYGGGLAAVQTTLSGRIAENKRNESYKVIPDLLPDADVQQIEEVVVVSNGGEEKRVYKVLNGEGALVGWAVPAAGQGFADRIELLFGVDPTVETITGLYVLDQKETPGLGDYITGNEFRGRFAGKSTDAPLRAVQGAGESEGEFTAVTGATISSQSIAEIINKAIANLKPALVELSAE